MTDTAMTACNIYSKAFLAKAVKDIRGKGQGAL